MTLSSEALITELYVGYFNRAPDTLGMRAWLAAVNAPTPTPLAKVADLFANSSEFHAPSDAGALVDQVYGNLLNRAADAAGRAFWVDQLSSGKVTTGGFVLAVESSVNQQTGTNDVIVLHEKVVAGQYWFDTLDSLHIGDFNNPSVTPKFSLLPLATENPTTRADLEAALTATDHWVYDQMDFAPGATFTPHTHPTLVGISDPTTV